MTRNTYVKYFCSRWGANNKKVIFYGMTFVFKKTETELKIQRLNGEFVFYVSKFIYLKSYNYLLQTM